MGTHQDLNCAVFSTYLESQVLLACRAYRLTENHNILHYKDNLIEITLHRLTKRQNLSIPYASVYYLYE